MPSKMQMCGVGSLGELTVRGGHSGGGWCAEKGWGGWIPGYAGKGRLGSSLDTDTRL